MIGAEGALKGPENKPLMWICALLVLIGAGAFIVGISGPQAQRAWQAYLVNFLFWSGLAFGTVLFVAILNMTNASWARPMKRMAEAPVAFLPISFGLFWVLYLGRGEIFPWISEPVSGKEGWLDVGFLFARDGAGLFLLTALSIALVYHSVRRDLALASEHVAIGQGRGPVSGTGIPFGDKGSDKGWRAQIVLSPILGILYPLVLSLLAFDLIMSLDPHWNSTLFGAYYFVGSFYTALAAIVIIAGIARMNVGLRPFILPRHFHDLGKLLLGFCLLTGDFFYSQFLVIWYGNLPEEAKYVILRIRQWPWEPLAWVVLVVCFAIPFVVLLSRKIKMKPGPMMVLSCVILAGMWLERFLLVTPSIWKEKGFPLGLQEALITAGFLGVWALSVMIFLSKFPPLPLSDPLFRVALEEAKRNA